MLSCIGIGSNAIRLLEADWRDGELIIVKRERRGTRLFAGLVDGKLETSSMQRSAEAVIELADIAKEDKTEGLFIMATSAVRDAENGHLFTEACESGTGAKVEILSGEEEAVYSYFGAARGGASGVIDIGGGSTEFTLGEDASVHGASSLQMGAVRMYEQIPVQSVADYRKTVDICRNIIEDNKDRLCWKKELTYDWTGVGGTMTTLGAMSQKIPLFDPVASEGMVMPYEEVRQWGEWLSGLSMDERKNVAGLMPHRADIIPSGIAILDAAMSYYDIPRMRLSARGNLDGFLKKRFLERA